MGAHYLGCHGSQLALLLDIGNSLLKHRMMMWLMAPQFSGVPADGHRVTDS